MRHERVSAATVTAGTGPPATFIRVLPAGAAVDGGSGVLEAVDEEGTLTAWFARHRTDVAVLCPDCFVYAITLEAPAPLSSGRPASGTGAER